MATADGGGLMMLGRALLVVAILAGAGCSEYNPNRVPSSAYAPLPAGVELLKSTEFGTEGAGRERLSRYLILDVPGASDGPQALERVKSHFADRATEFTTSTVFAFPTLVARGKKGFSVIHVGLLRDYLTDPGAVPRGLEASFQGVARTAGAHPVLVVLDP